MLIGGQRLLDALLHPTGLRGIEMHPQVIHQQRQGGMLTALGQRAQQAVLQMPHRQLPLPAQSLHPPCAGAPAPGQQRLNILATARQQLGRCQQRRHGAMGQQTGLRHPEALNHRVGGNDLNPLQ